MSTWMIQARRFIKRIMGEKVAGDASMYMICMYLVLLLMIIFKLAFDVEQVYVTYDSVEDSLVTALVSSCVCNTDEYGISEQIVIYRDLTPPPLPPIYQAILAAGGVLPFPLPPPYDPLNDPEIYSPNGDSYLDNCYDTFCKNLKHNLKLDADMNASISGIDGKVTIEEFSVFNVYRDFNDAGAQTGYRIVKYTHQDNGNWTVHDYGIDTPASAYSSLEKADIEILDTSVTARISFDIVKSDYSAWLMPRHTEDDMKQSVSYQRIVDVKTD